MTLSSQEIGISTKKIESVLSDTLTWPLASYWVAPWADAIENKDRQATCVSVSNGLPLRGVILGLWKEVSVESRWKAKKKMYGGNGELICKWEETDELSVSVSSQSTPSQFLAFLQTSPPQQSEQGVG